MGYIPANVIKTGAQHLLSVLRQELAVKYSRFYDGTVATNDALAAALELEEYKNWYCVAYVIDLAAYELEKQWMVRIAELPERLVDGTNNYEIALTEKGRQANCSIRGLKFWDAE